LPKRTIDEVKVTKSRFESCFREFYHYNTWVDCGCIGNFCFIGFFGYYFSEITVVKRISFCNVYLIFVILIVVYLKKSHDSENRRLFWNCRKGATKASPVISWRQKSTLKKRWTAGKVQLTDGTEGWIESDAIRRK
jgi:hypothetical protein